MTTATFAATPATTTTTQDMVALLGRLLVAPLFLMSGWGKLTGFSGAVGYIASKGLPMPSLGAAIAIVVELILVAMLVLGWRARLAAWGIAIFTVAAGIFFHNYWSVPEAQMAMQRIHFFKNISIAGGLLAFAAFGPGRWSLDARFGRA